MTPMLSIILPTYNGGLFLREQIDSILTQSHRDFELLILDDGSSDASVVIADRYAAVDQRVSVLPTSGRAGQANRLLTLSQAAHGEFVAIADQDDIWDSERNHKLLAAIGDRAMAIGRSELIDKDGKHLGTSLLDRLNRPLDPGLRLRALIQPMFSGHAMVVRRSSLNPAAFASPLMFDWLMALDALYSDGIVYVEEAIVLHRIHGGNQVNNLDMTIDPGHLSRALIREAFLNQRASRLKFWLVLSYLGRSDIVPFADRQIFAKFADRCHMAWYSHWRSVKPFKTTLAQEIKDEVGCFGSIEEDRRFFGQHVDKLAAVSTIGAGFRDIYERLKAREMA
jgi:glycosyltransferase involved in cell wall biosynthesis